MTKYRIHYQNDDVKVECFPWHIRDKNFPEMSDKDFMDAMTVNHPIHGPTWINKEFFDCEENNLPTRETRDRWYPDFNSEQKIKVDTNWELKLMKDIYIKNKAISNLKKKYEEEFNKSSRNNLSLLDLSIEISNLESKDAGFNNNNIFWAELALDGLDKRVLGGESDKPLIREKLNAKLAELRQAK